MEYLQTWLDNSEIPIITAFLLGLLTAVSPCPLATNITAIGFISKDINNRNRIFTNGVLYTLGRVLAYSALGAILIAILRKGADMFAIQKGISEWGELLLAPALILIGLFMLSEMCIRDRAYSVAGIGKFYNRVQTFQKWFNNMVAILFILVGIYYGLINLGII